MRVEKTSPPQKKKKMCTYSNCAIVVYCNLSYSKEKNPYNSELYKTAARILANHKVTREEVIIPT